MHFHNLVRFLLISLGFLLIRSRCIQAMPRCVCLLAGRLLFPSRKYSPTLSNSSRWSSFDYLYVTRTTTVVASGASPANENETTKGIFHARTAEESFVSGEITINSRLFVRMHTNGSADEWERERARQTSMQQDLHSSLYPSPRSIIDLTEWGRKASVESTTNVKKEAHFQGSNAEQSERERGRNWILIKRE